MHWKKLQVWEKSHELTVSIYQNSAKWRKESYALADQIRRSAQSVPANIVEGQSRNTTKEYLNFLYIARGSLEETRYFLLLGHDLQFFTKKDFDELEGLSEAVSKLLNGLIKSLNKLSSSSNP